MERPMTNQISRRNILTGSAFAAASLLATTASAQENTKIIHSRPSDVPPKDGPYNYEIGYTEADWKDRLSAEEFRILREGGTEKKKSSPLWNEKRAGHYSCKGCELRVYSSEYKVALNKGWAFFKHSESDSVLTGIDQYTNYGSSKQNTVIEAHCRRCGSHFGHILYMKGQILHCINGTSLTFRPAA